MEHRHEVEILADGKKCNHKRNIIITYKKKGGFKFSTESLDYKEHLKSIIS